MKTILQSPLITEKNALLTKTGVYVFKVHKEATKPEIKEATEKGFSVKVVGVRTVVCRSALKMGRRGITPVKHWKKAFVQLADGQKISLFEGA